MAVINSPKAKPRPSEPPRPLTEAEIESLRREMKESSDFMRQELRRRQEERSRATTSPQASD